MKYAVLFVLIVVALCYFNNSAVDRFAKDFITDEMSKKSINGWYSMETVVPVFAMFESNYEVTVEVRKKGEKKYIPTRINGNCLISNCVISATGFDFLQLR